MKKLFLLFMCVLFLTSCADDKYICLKENNQECYTFKTYGVLNINDKNDLINYNISWGNVFWGVVLIETIVVPIILFGWYLYEPVGLTPVNEKGPVKGTL